MTFKVFQPSSCKVYLEPNHVCCVMNSNSGLHSTSRVWHFFFFLSVSQSLVQQLNHNLFWELPAPYSMVAGRAYLNIQMVLVLEKWLYFDQNICTSFLQACMPIISSMEVWTGKTEPSLTGRMRPKFYVALLCQTCQEREMDSYWAEVAADRVDEVERIADWQLSSITCPTWQMQVDRKGDVG